VLAELGYVLALGDVIVLSRLGRFGDAGNFGDLGMTHRYTSGAFAGSVAVSPNHDQEFWLS
jgi:hypothetical protein